MNDMMEGMDPEGAAESGRNQIAWNASMEDSDGYNPTEGAGGWYDPAYNAVEFPSMEEEEKYPSMEDDDDDVEDKYPSMDDEDLEDVEDDDEYPSMEDDDDGDDEEEYPSMGTYEYPSMEDEEKYPSMDDDDDDVEDKYPSMDDEDLEDVEDDDEYPSMEDDDDGDDEEEYPSMGDDDENPSIGDEEEDDSTVDSAWHYSADDSAGYPSMEAERDKAADVETVIRRIEESQTNISFDDYTAWRNIGFALAREFGAGGRDYFHRVSRFSLKYTPVSCDAQFEAGLLSQGEGITIKTFFYHAKNAGIDISPAKQGPFQSAGMSSASGKMEVSSESLKVGMGANGAYDAPASPIGASVKEMEEMAKPEELWEMEEVSVEPSNSLATSKVSPNDRIQPEELAFDTPRIPKHIYDVLPEFLQDCVNVFRTPVERDVFLVGALGVISGCLPNMEGRYFGHPVSPHLYVFVAAPAGSGKGNLKWARLLGDKIHNGIYWAAHHAQFKYLDDIDRYRKMNANQRMQTSRPVPPRKQMLYLSPNLGIDSFLQTLKSSHSRGIVFETEADTLQATLRHRWSPFSDILRKAFHHETIQLDNRKDLKPIEVDNPHLSVVLAGTPDQVRQMMPDTENGLFSRFLFYAFEDDPGFSYPFGDYGDVDLQQFFNQQAYVLLELYEILARNYKPLQFCLTPRQEKDFYDVFEYRTSINRGKLGKDFEATTRRMGLIAYRIAMVLSGLRLMEQDTGNEPVTCRVEDFWTAIDLAGIFEKHAIAVYNSLPNTKLKGARNVFFNALPDTFTRKEYLTVAAEIDLNPKTAEKYIGQMKESGLLEHGFNKYMKRGGERRGPSLRGPSQSSG